MTRSRRGHPSRARAGDQRGAIPVEWVAGLGVLVLPVAMLVAVLPGWAERQVAARVVARETARAVALAPHDAAGGEALALARRVAANHGLASDEVDVAVDVATDAAGRPARHGEVIVTVGVRVPLVAVPLVGEAGGWRLAVTHAEPLDRYRSLPP